MTSSVPTGVEGRAEGSGGAYGPRRRQRGRPREKRGCFEDLCYLRGRSGDEELRRAVRDETCRLYSPVKMYSPEGNNSE